MRLRIVRLLRNQFNLLQSNNTIINLARLVLGIQETNTMKKSIIIPALDLIDGKVVRLHQGDYAKQTTYSDNPIEQFASYLAQGAEQLHLVDLTGAKDPAKRQTALIGKIISETNCKIQVGGGIRTEQDVADLLAGGGDRVVVCRTPVEERAMGKGLV